jgi:hypothetical protein
MTNRRSKAAAEPTRWAVGMAYDGRAVLSAEPASGPGGWVPNAGLLTLQLEGQEVPVYGCQDDLEGPWTRKVDAHQHRVDVHGDAPSKGLAPGSRLTLPAALANMTLAEFIEMTQALANVERQLADMEAERDKWRDRAVQAEGELKELRAQARRTARTLAQLGVKLGGEPAAPAEPAAVVG